MKISVIVLNWNGRRHLEVCLPALAAQTFRDFELVLVDNGSSDDSVPWVRRWHPWARVVALAENRGFSGGNLAGLAEAKGAWVVLLNNDTRPEPDWLEHLAACADAHPEAGIVAAHLTDWNGVLTDSAGDGCRVTGRGYARHCGFPASTAPESGPVFGACAGAALYRRELIDDVGFLDTDFFLNFEDTDLSMRARLLGWQAWFCREAVVRHRVSASQGVWSPWNVYYGARNHLWACFKNMPAWLLLKYSPLTAAEILAVGGRSFRHGRGWEYVRGVLAGLGGLPRLWPRRREIQRRRRVTVRAFGRQLSFPPWTRILLRRRKSG